MTIDRNITQKNYSETKAIVDEVIIDEDYRYADEPYYDPDVTMLEILRTIFAFDLAKRHKKPRNKKQIESLVDKAGVQQWLDWVHQTRNEGVDIGYGHKISTPESYPKNPGLGKWTYLGIFMKNGVISGPGRTCLYYNKMHKVLQENPPVYDDHAISEVSAHANYGVKLYEPEFFDMLDTESAEQSMSIIKGKMARAWPARVLLRFAECQSTMMFLHDPFEFDSPSVQLQAALQASQITKLELTKNLIQGIVDQAKWPENLEKELILNVSGEEYGDDEGHGDSLRVTFYLRFRQMNHLLEEEDFDLLLGQLKYGKEDSPEEIFEAFHSDRTYGMVLADHIFNNAKREAAKLKRRMRKNEKNGDGRLNIDKVALHMLQIIKEHDQESHDRILSGRAVSVQVPLEKLKGFIKGRSPKENAKRKTPKTKEKISFKLTEGEIRARFHINDDIFWDNTRLNVPRLPDAAMQSLIGRPAREVVSHPIADLLGPVSKAYKARYGNATWVKFMPITDNKTVEEIAQA